MKTLVTGGAGFIGSHLADALLAEGHQVRIIDNLSTGKASNLPIKAEFIHQDLLATSWNDDICSDIDCIFHLAAIPSVPRSIAAPIITQRSGEMTTVSLLQSAVRRKVKKIIFAASSSAYGNANSPQVETMLPNPMSPYAASKIACENYIKAFCHCFDIEGICLRYFNVFGPRQDPSSPYSGVISVFMKEMKNGVSPTVFGDGLQTRDFIYVDNVVQANIMAMRSNKVFKGETFNIGSGQGISINDLVSEMNKALNTDLKPIYKDERKGDVRHSCANIEAAKTVLGYDPTISFSAGIELLAKSNTI